MRQLTDDIKTVVEALKKSKMLEVSKDETMVRRTTQLPEVDTSDVRSIYAVCYSFFL